MSIKREIKWKLHLNSSPKKVYQFLATSDGRSKFWAEDSVEENGIINFRFSNGINYQSKIIRTEKERVFMIEYFDLIVAFYLNDDDANGTDLTLINNHVSQDEYSDMLVGWVSVLLALKGAIDFKIDLRNHDVKRTWDDFYVDN